MAKGDANGVSVGLADVQTGVSLRQAKVVDALASGETPSEAAVTCSVGRVTIYGWLKQDTFRDALQSRRRELASAMAGRLQELGETAVGVLLDYLKDQRRSDFDGLPARVRLSERLVKGLGLTSDATPDDRD
jgi:hypothetical protein